MKIKENQSLSGYDLLTLLGLMVATVIGYGTYSRHIFSSEKISSNQVKAEILAYQAAQIFLLKNADKRNTKQARGIASEGGTMEGNIGEDTNGKPFRFQVIQDGSDNYRVILTSDSEGSTSSDNSIEPIADLKIDLSQKK